MSNQSENQNQSAAMPCSPVEYSRETPIMNAAMEWADRRDLLYHIGILERKVNELASGLRETLAILKHSDTSYPQHEGWWSHERAREIETILPENPKDQERTASPVSDCSEI